MREIKFRAWVKSTSTMDYNPQVYSMTNLRLAFNDINRVFMQFTGINDKNNRQIFEGDVLEYKSWHVHKRWWANLEDIPVIEEEVRKQKEDVSVNRSDVKFSNGQFHLSYPITAPDIARGERFERSRSAHGDIEQKWWDFEVIGNIHENPELLSTAK